MCTVFGCHFMVEYILSAKPGFIDKVVLGITYPGNGRYIPKAAKWLRERRWDNLVPLPVASYDIEELEELSRFDLPEEMEL